MRKLQVFWGIAAGFFVLAGVVLCVLGLHYGTILVKTDRDPGKAVTGFFRELSEGDLDAAYARLSNYKTLGLENKPRTDGGKALLTALRESYQCSLLEDAEQRGDRAVQRIQLRFLDLDALEARIRSGKAANIPDALTSAEELSAQAEFTVSLHYDGENWLIELDQGLLDAIQGHVPGEDTL